MKKLFTSPKWKAFRVNEKTSQKSSSNNILYYQASMATLPLLQGQNKRVTTKSFKTTLS